MQLPFETEKRYCSYCRLELTSDDINNFHIKCKQEFLKFNTSKVKAINTIGLKTLFLVGIFFYTNSFILIFDLFRWEINTFGVGIYFIILIPIITAIYLLLASIKHLDEVNTNEYFTYLTFNIIIILVLVSLSDYHSNFLYWPLLAENFQIFLIILLILSFSIYILNYTYKNYRIDTRLTITIACIFTSWFFISIIDGFLIQKNFMSIIANEFPYKYYFILTCELLVLFPLGFKFLQGINFDDYLSKLIDNPKIEKEFKKLGIIFLVEFVIGIALSFIY